MKSSVIGIFLLFVLPLCCIAQVEYCDYSPKFSAATVSKIQSYQSLKKNRNVVSGVESLFAYVRLSPGANVEDLCSCYNVHLNVGYNGLYTAVIPMDILESFAKEETVLDVDAGKEVHLMMDSVRILTHVDEVHVGIGLPTSYQGEGTIIGIIDRGFDFTHPNFRDENGDCRIRYVWDQNQFLVTSNSSYGYGLEYSTTEQILAAKRDMSGETHGTHVAGIATGSWDNVYKGIAPKSEIVLISVNGTEQGILDGIDFLLHYADEKNKRISINLSMGTVLGYKDGTDSFSILIDNLMKGKQGKLLSIAAGNEGHRKTTLTGTFNEAQKEIKSYLVPPSYDRDNLFIQGVVGSTYTVTISLKDTLSNKLLFSESFISGEKWSKSYTGFGSEEKNDAVLNISSDVNLINNNPAFNVYLSYTKPESEVWEIALSSNQGKYMINCDYGYFSSAGKEGYMEGSTDYTIACTATGFEIISVGAYVSKEEYTDILGTVHRSDWSKFHLYPLSGKGPTYDGRIKPDVVAPGATVISSFNSYAASYSVATADKALEIEDISGRKYSWGMANGTSMATPVVTGTLALWLEANPELTVYEVKEIIQKTATEDIYTGELPNGKYGMGKLNTVAGLYEILKQTSVEKNKYLDIDYIYDRNTGWIKFLSEVPLEQLCIYSASGELLDVQTNLKDNEFQLCQYPAGIYLIKIRTQNILKVFKVAR